MPRLEPGNVYDWQYGRLQLRCRVLSMAEVLRLRALRRETMRDDLDDEALAAAIVAALEVAVVAYRNGPGERWAVVGRDGGIIGPAGALRDVLTYRGAVGLLGAVYEAQADAESAAELAELAEALPAPPGTPALRMPEAAGAAG